MKRPFEGHGSRIHIISGELILLQMSSSPESRLEKRFRTTTVYKRSKQYFDISRLNKLEQKEELSRRMPSQKSNEGVTAKFSESFYSADIKNQERVQTELSKFQTRNWKEELDQTDTDYTSPIKKGGTLNMEKMLSREYYQKSIRFHENQNHFCNFRPYLLPNNHSVYFEKYTGQAENQPHDSSKVKTQGCIRCKSKGDQYMNSIPSITEPEVGKVREKLIFDESLFRTLVDFKKNRKEKSERKEGEVEQTPQIDLERIRLGEEMSKKMANLGLVEFYHGEAKWKAPQMDNRLLKQNQYWLRMYNREGRHKMEWNMRKKKDDLIEARKVKILGRKHIKDIKGEICDQKFFRRNYH